MEKSIIEHNIDKSLNAIKTDELDYAIEYVNAILGENPSNVLASQIKKYILILNQLDWIWRKRIDFFISILKEPRANEMFPLIELLCNDIHNDDISFDYMELLIEQIMVSKLEKENEVLNDFYHWLGKAYVFHLRVSR